MIVDRCDPVNLFELVPKLNLHFEPELAHLDELLDDDELFNLVKADLLKRYPNSGRLGRHSTPVEVARSKVAVQLQLRTDRAIRQRLDRLEAVHEALPAEVSRRHHPHPLGERDRF